MAKINLLPWREEIRKQKQHEFVISAAGGALIAAQILIINETIDVKMGQ